MLRQRELTLEIAITLVLFISACSNGSLAVGEETLEEDAAVAGRLVVEAPTTSDTETLEQSPASVEEVELPEAAPATAPTSIAVTPEVESVIEPPDTEAEPIAPEPTTGQQVTSTVPTTSVVAETEVVPEVNVATIDIPENGASAWAVVVAGASDPFDPLLEDTVEQLEQAGHSTTITNCDAGAAEALALQPLTSFTVSVYVANESDATALSEQFEADGLPVEATEILVQCP